MCLNPGDSLVNIDSCIQLPITKSIQNDKQGFSQLFENCFHQYYESLHRYAYTITKSNHDAGDIVQFVFAKWWEKGETLVIQQDIRSYLYKTVYNQSLNYVRNKRNRKTDLVDFGDSDIDSIPSKTEDLLLNKELVTQLNRALEMLPPQCKLIFYKSRFEEKKYSEIAAELNLSVKTVEAQIGKALKILRQKLFENNVSILLFIISFMYRVF